MIPGAAAFVSHALPLATELLPLTGLLKELCFVKNYQMCERFSGAMYIGSPGWMLKAS